MAALNIPSIGSTSWGSQVNTNWTSLQNALASVNGLRLTSVSGNPVPSTDLATVAAIYLTPYLGDAVSLYTGANWDCFNTSEVSLSLSGLTAGKNYDVFAYWNGSAVALELSAAWTNDSTRTDAISRLNGIWVKSAAVTRRLMGTIRATSISSTTDTVTQRFLWNANNQIERKLLKVTNATWFYAAAAWRPANNDLTLRVEVVVGISMSTMKISANSLLIGGGTVVYAIGIGEDTTSAASHDRSVSGIGISSGSYGSGITAELIKVPAIGYHYYQLIEYSVSGNSGTSPQVNDHTGLLGTIMG